MCKMRLVWILTALDGWFNWKCKFISLWTTRPSLVCSEQIQQQLESFPVSMTLICRAAAREQREREQRELREAKGRNRAELLSETAQLEDMHETWLLQVKDRIFLWALQPHPLAARWSYCDTYKCKQRSDGWMKCNSGLLIYEHE